MSTMIHRTLVFAIVLTANLAFAQTASSEGIITQSGWCLDVTGSFTRTNPPPIGARVVAARCTGRASQRWTKLSGDYNWVQSIGGRRLTVGATRRNGRWPVELGERHPSIDLVNGTLRAHENRCVTRHGTTVLLEGCRAGDPSQRWSMQ